MTAVTCTNAPAVKHSFSPLTWLATAIQTRRERVALSQLDDHRLKDLGLTRAEADREAGRPIWDVPAHW
ncbi:Uncharacterized conserved protein YjiS, DUF1127 family [Aliiroseovarius halocynthiae]|uniref:DUF1127 domain-containing protein n=1 Tax=Aliiroseovarius halocynthiae TaxID=985055 RepID=A0A545STV6_9RHOB|nr:DUF1127 domain-containing protein [Aliiroseovarius halocynthiae]TQV68394.1 DUF1127 domain-containing protein [Aliiroseovarius halocynthiae]SMR70786.1 Uncharacterized conserved protein YjiS, DUF1127 family [Aliiroseovarius halocynthiae]